MFSLPSGPGPSATVADKEKEASVTVKASEDEQKTAPEPPKADAASAKASKLSSLDAYFNKLNGTNSSSSSSSSASSDAPIESATTTSSETQTAAASQQPVAAVPVSTATSATTAEQPSTSASPSSTTAATGGESTSGEKKGLSALNAYFDKLNVGKEKKPDPFSPTSPSSASTSQPSATTTATTTLDKPSDASSSSSTTSSGSGSVEDKELKAEDVEELVKRIVEEYEKKKATGAIDAKVSSRDFAIDAIIGPRSLLDEWISARAADTTPTAMYTLVAINVAVFLFQLASPELVPGVITTSIPALLGAKVNPLISAGEWWRLATPMFLHAGIIHLSIGTFFLLGIGSVLEFALGPIGFLGAYLTSGVVGNLVSFLQTPDVTVGGTGPIYGIVAAYAAFLIKNREAIGTEAADNNVRESLIIASLFALFANPLPIDPCTHAGAAAAGFLFGTIASPTMRKVQLSKEEAARRNTQGLLATLLNGQKAEEEPASELVLDAVDSSRVAAAYGASLALGFVLFQLSQGERPNMDLLQSMSGDSDGWL